MARKRAIEDNQRLCSAGQSLPEGNVGYDAAVVEVPSIVIDWGEDARNSGAGEQGG